MMTKDEHDELTDYIKECRRKIKAGQSLSIIEHIVFAAVSDEEMKRFAAHIKQKPFEPYKPFGGYLDKT